MSFVYTRSNFYVSLNRHIQGKIGMLVDPTETMNEAVRTTFSEVDLRSARRKATLAPSLFNQEYMYSCPSDLKSYGIIDIPQQAAREDGEFNLVPSAQFAFNKKIGDISIDDYNGARTLLISSVVSDKTVVISDLDALTSGGGTWVIRGDATTLAADTDDYFKGNGSLKFNISSAGGTTAGIQNTTLNAVDLTNYLGGNGAVFVWAKINSVTGLTSYTLELGTNTSNYYSKTVTTQNDGSAFVSGWNLLRFDLSSLTTVGTPTITSIRYASIYMTKAITKVSESDYKFDYLVLKSGKNADVRYYSKYGWQTSAGAYIENSTSATDYLVADTDEYDLIVKKGVAIASRELDFPEPTKNVKDKDYETAAKNYMLKNPSESKVTSYEYYAY